MAAGSFPNFFLHIQGCRSHLHIRPSIWVLAEVEGYGLPCFSGPAGPKHSRSTSSQPVSWSTAELHLICGTSYLGPSSPSCACTLGSSKSRGPGTLGVPVSPRLGTCLLCYNVTVRLGKPHTSESPTRVWDMDSSCSTTPCTAATGDPWWGKTRHFFPWLLCLNTTSLSFHKHTPTSVAHCFIGFQLAVMCHVICS